MSMVRSLRVHFSCNLVCVIHDSLGVGVYYAVVALVSCVPSVGKVCEMQNDIAKFKTTFFGAFRSGPN